MQDLPLPALAFGWAGALAGSLLWIFLVWSVRSKRFVYAAAIANLIGIVAFAVAEVVQFPVLTGILIVFVVPIVEETIRSRVISTGMSARRAMQFALVWATTEFTVNAVAGLGMATERGDPSREWLIISLMPLFGVVAFHIFQSQLMRVGFSKGHSAGAIIIVASLSHMFYNFYALFAVEFFARNPTAGLVAITLQFVIILVAAVTAYRWPARSAEIGDAR